MDKPYPPKLDWVVVARGIFPFYLLATVSDILLHQPPYQIAKSNADITYQLFGLILGWLPLLILIVTGAERASQLLPASSRNLLDSLDLLTLCTASGMKNAFTLGLLLLPADVLSTSAPLMPLQATIVIVKWAGIGLLAFALLPGRAIHSGSSRVEQLKRAIHVVLLFLFVVFALFLIIKDVTGLVQGQ